jgi:ubiquinone/menaquinone biosynthesis C-methylase UbiE
VEFNRGNLEWGFFKNHLPSVEGKTLLDVGCGYGGRSVHYALMGARVVGIDIKPERFKMSYFFARQHGVEKRVEFQIADAAELPFASNSFDVVISNNAIQYIANPRKSLQECRRVVKPEGLICINFGPPWFAPVCPDIGAVFPWTHLIFPQEAIKKAYIRMGKGDYFKGRTDNIYKYNNRLSIKSYKQLILSVDLELLYFKLWTRPYVAPLIHVPFLKEFFCAQIISVSRKKSRDLPEC